MLTNSQSSKFFYVLLFVFSIPVSLWDAFTTFVGVSNIIPNNLFIWFLTILINGILALTYPILKNKDPHLGGFAKLLWFLAICCDIYTSFEGNRDYAGMREMNQSQMFLIGCMTLFTVGATLTISNLVFEKNIFGNLTD